MKIIVSSKTLAKCLNDLDLENYPMERVIANNNQLTFITASQSSNLWCDILIFKPMVLQDGRRWDWVKDLVNNIGDQPIVLNITQQNVNIIFSY